MTETFRVVNGDWVLDRRLGRMVTVRGRDKLRQDGRELLTIATQPNGFGAGLDDLLGRDVDPEGFRLDIARAIRRSVATLQRLQDQFLARRRTPEERLAAIASLDVSAVDLGGGTARTGFGFRLVVRPVRGEALTLSGAGS